MPTKIEWCDETINPIQDKIKGESGRGYHCTKCSPGCLNCYAEGINNRFGNHLPFDGRKAEFELVESELEKPLKWKKPRSIFVQSMGDLFHEDVPDDFRIQAYRSMAQVGQHTFLILTKRPKIMAGFCKTLNYYNIEITIKPINRPLNHVWHGLTVCNQQEWDDKGKLFLQIPGKKFLSIEPMLSNINLGTSLLSFHIPDHFDRDLKKYSYPDQHGIDAVILGGETGPGARPMNTEWVRSVRNQCVAAGVPFFLKRVSKKEGRILDGQTHDSLPWVKP
jgi:protein gp37